MVTNEEYEKAFLLSREMVRFVKLLTNKTDCNSELCKYLESIGCEFNENRTLKGFIQLFIEEDILNCYFLLGYQQIYKRELFMLLDMIEYGFHIHDVPWSYEEFQNVYEIYSDFFCEVFDIKKNALKSTDFPTLYIYLSEVGDNRADEYVSILQKIAIVLSKNQDVNSKQKDERIDILLSNPQSFLEDLYEDKDINLANDEIINDNNNEEQNNDDMELLKDKLFNGVSFEIIKEEYREGCSSPFVLKLRVTNFNDCKKKIGIEMKYISLKFGLKEGHLWEFGRYEKFLQDNTFVDLEVGFEDITDAHDGDRIEMKINEGKFASLRLIRERKQWAILESIERNTYNRELKSKIEQFEAIEEQYGITLQNFSVKVEDENNMKVFCEVLALNGELPKENFTINVAIYDNNNEIVYTDSESKYADDFKGFEVLTFDRIRLDISIDEISKIRIYPTR